MSAKITDAKTIEVEPLLQPRDHDLAGHYALILEVA